MSLSIFLLRLFGLVIGLLFVGFFVSERREKRRREREGFWVEVLFYGQLRGEEDAWAVVYHEENKTLWFTGIIAPRRQCILFVPSSQNWVRFVSPWATDKRDLILRRIEPSLNSKYMRIEEVDD